jgi:hypothetical protein
MKAREAIRIKFIEIPWTVRFRAICASRVSNLFFEDC